MKKSKLIIYWNQWFRSNGEVYADKIIAEELPTMFRFTLVHDKQNRTATINLYKTSIRGYTVVNNN